MYDAVNDSRTRPSHAALDDMVTRHDDPIWRIYRVPNEYQCRCRIIALSERQAGRYIEADRKRMENPDYTEAKPDKGWDYDICADPTEGVRRAWERRLSNCAWTMFSATGGGKRCTETMVAIMRSMKEQL